ncbi:hypothetical protein PF005_g27671 [Phytophthora fragariae]|nr:hypothetical protein PF003_g33142 [Phytophthora fragariae]KAE8922637.1 hypothetical protein PF009_g27100 [Phytophthora fragariae]KAE8962185.1 hypothetical protein PF011_g29478 [Phytophthora fragariae]KAE9068259.1 hypothetical protein PF010_g27132 [Phytophthora fragariae]KAE9071846.1 hypothetical protein PF007_g26398 [Phytophthora fragariae]
MFTEGSVRFKISFLATPTVEMDECSMSSNSVVESSDADEDDEDDDWEVRSTMTKAAEAALVIGG